MDVTDGRSDVNHYTPTFSKKLYKKKLGKKPTSSIAALKTFLADSVSPEGVRNTKDISFSKGLAI